MYSGRLLCTHKRSADIERFILKEYIDRMIGNLFKSADFELIECLDGKGFGKVLGRRCKLVYRSNRAAL